MSVFSLLARDVSQLRCLAMRHGLLFSDLKPLRFDHECILHVNLAHMCGNTAFNLQSMVMRGCLVTVI